MTNGEAIALAETERQAAFDAVRPYRAQINGSPALISILYDIDLLPEQITRYVNARRLVAFCEIFKRLTPEAAASLFEKMDGTKDGTTTAVSPS